MEILWDLSFSAGLRWPWVDYVLWRHWRYKENAREKYSYGCEYKNRSDNNFTFNLYKSMNIPEMYGIVNCHSYLSCVTEGLSRIVENLGSLGICVTLVRSVKCSHLTDNNFFLTKLWTEHRHQILSASTGYT
jgi:hypothetical protein